MTLVYCEVLFTLNISAAGKIKNLVAGKVNEKRILDGFLRENGTDMTYFPVGFVIHPSEPWLGASPDGILINNMDKNETWLLEIKNIQFAGTIAQKLDGQLGADKTLNSFIIR
jgi:hypothetical protein